MNPQIIKIKKDERLYLIRFLKDENTPSYKKAFKDIVSSLTEIKELKIDGKDLCEYAFILNRVLTPNRSTLSTINSILQFEKRKEKILAYQVMEFSPLGLSNILYVDISNFSSYFSCYNCSGITFSLIPKVDGKNFSRDIMVKFYDNTFVAIDNKDNYVYSISIGASGKDILTRKVNFNVASSPTFISAPYKIKFFMESKDKFFISDKPHCEEQDKIIEVISNLDRANGNVYYLNFYEEILKCSYYYEILLRPIKKYKINMSLGNNNIHMSWFDKNIQRNIYISGYAKSRILLPLEKEYFNDGLKILNDTYLNGTIDIPKYVNLLETCKSKEEQSHYDEAASAINSWFKKVSNEKNSPSYKEQVQYLENKIKNYNQDIDMYASFIEKIENMAFTPIPSVRIDKKALYNISPEGVYKLSLISDSTKEYLYEKNIKVLFIEKRVPNIKKIRINNLYNKYTNSLDLTYKNLEKVIK